MARNPNLSHIFKRCRENSVHISAGAVEQKTKTDYFCHFQGNAPFSRQSFIIILSNLVRKTSEHKEVVCCKKN